MSDTPDPDVQTNPITGQPITPPGPQPTGPKGLQNPIPAVSDYAIELMRTGLEIPNALTVSAMAVEIQKARGTYVQPPANAIHVPPPEPTDEQIKDYQANFGIIE